MVYLLVFLAGVLMAGMQSFNGLLSAYTGMFGTSLIVHVIGGLLLALYILLVLRKPIKLGPMPWYLYSAGFLGMILVAFTSVCVGKLGAAATACLSISGQLGLSVLMDHFGWMGVERVKFQKKRIPCLLLIVCGLVIVNLAS